LRNSSLARLGELDMSIRQFTLRVGIFFVAALAAGAASNPPPESKPGLHPGPAVWIEEYYDVKPGKLDEFVQTYRREVYSVSRRISGYRGYTVLTNIKDENGRPQSGRTPDSMLTPHYGIFLDGKTLTERAIDLGNLLRRTHNVIVIHHLQSWQDANSFRKCVSDTYEKEHPGERYADHLAKTIYPLSANFWETDFRLIVTGLPYEAKPGKDADGLDLEPHASDTGWFKEYFDVKAENLDKWINVYENNTYAVMNPIPGYRGVTLVTTLPPGKAEAARTGYAGQVLGGPREFFVPAPGMMMDGTVRTDTSVNYSMLFKDTFTIITYYQLPWEAKMLQEMQKNFEKTNPGEDRLKHITKVFFPLSQNHWDMWYRPIETSLAVSASPRSVRAGCHVVP
jgi:hypothetical protein